MATIYYDNDADLSLLKDKTIAILGYGSQGHAQAQNLRDSGCNVIIGQRPGSANYDLAVSHGFEPLPIEEATKRGDLVNILLPDEGGVKIADMGLAEGLATHSDEESGNTFAGSPYYVCPEIILGRTLDHRSDLYSLGASFFEMLTGRPPFEGNDLTEVAGKHLYEKPPDPRQYVPDLPLAACNVIHRLLQKEPSERYQCADELNQSLQVEVLLSRSTRDTTSSGIRAAAAPSRWKCPTCGRLNSESSRYCLDCGATAGTRARCAARTSPSMLCSARIAEAT